MNEKTIMFTIAIFLILNLNFISSAPPVTSLIKTDDLTIATNLATYIPQNQLREWDIHVINTTKVFTQSGSVSCILHLYKESGNGGHLFKSPANSTFTDNDIEIIVPAEYFANKGVYSSKVYCNSSGQTGLYESIYYVTKSGYPVADDFFMTFIYILFAVSFVILVYTMFISMINFVVHNETVFGVLFSWMGYFLLFFVQYLSSEYFIRTFVENTTSILINVTWMTNLIFPVISLLVSFIYRGFEKKKMPTVQEWMGTIRR